MAIKYNFKYMPLVGKLSGESMARQTETAINEIAQIVNDNTAQAEVINTLAQQANDNSVEALEKANEALETSGRVYINEPLPVNLNNYCESQLIYIANVQSSNLPIIKRGFLEVKTDDLKTECVQLFISDDEDVYVRSGIITAETVGDVTTYSATFLEWTSLSSPTILLQAGSGTLIPLSSDLDDFVNEGTYYCTATNASSLENSPYTAGEFKLIVMKFATDNYGLQLLYPSGGSFYVRKYLNGVWEAWETLATKGYVDTKTADYLPLSGGTMTGTITSSAVDFIKRNVNNNHLTIMGGTGYSNSASILLNGGESPSNAGAFQLLARDGTTSRLFIGKPDGTLTWHGSNIALSEDVLSLSGGTLTGQLVINRDNGYTGGGIKLTGAGQNFAISTLNTNVTKGTAPSATQYWGIDFYGGSNTSYNQRIGMLETTLNANNVATTAIRAYNCTTNTNTGNCAITVSVDGSGNAYTSAPTPAAGDNSTKIATTAFVNTKAGNYLPLTGGTITGNLKVNGYISKSTNTAALNINGGSDSESGAYLNLYGKSHASSAGAFSLSAYDGTTRKQLIGLIDGTLTWGGTAISLNGHTHSYLPLSGGTLTGNLVINKSSPGLYFKNTDIVRNTAPSSDVSTNITVQDKNGVNLAHFQNIYRADKENLTRMVAFKGTTTDSTWTAISVGYDNNGNVFTYAPTPAASSNTTHIATTAWVNTKLGSYLPLSGGTLTGSLYLTSLLNFKANHAKGTTPSAWREQSIRFADNSGEVNDVHLFGMLRNEIGTDGAVVTRLVAYKNTASSNTNAGIGITYPASGDPYAWTVTPPANSNSTAIPTTAWVNTKLGSYLPLAGGTMTGDIKRSGTVAKSTNDTSYIRFWGGSADTNGADMILWGKSHSTNPGNFRLIAHDGTNSAALYGTPSGALTWKGNNILTAATTGTTVSSSTSSSISLTSATAKTITSISLVAGTWVVNGHINYGSPTANKTYGAEISLSANHYGYSDEGAGSVHTSSTSNAVVNVTRIISATATTTVYLCGYATAAATVSTSHITAVRIK